MGCCEHTRRRLRTARYRLITWLKHISDIDSNASDRKAFPLPFWSWITPLQRATVRVLMWDEQQPEQKRAYGEKFLGETISDLDR